MGAPLIRAQDVSSQSRPRNDGSFKFAARTSFSCVGRAAGYYADVETGCQIYHMCDGLGRQFSYACPNTTLFQQRMLICDHWYMVNCSKAESNYAANLLIGQRDKPFVPEEENEIRTPRPDLLDQPDALDFVGPALMSFFKATIPAPQNAIFESQARSRPGAVAVPGSGKAANTKKSSIAEIFQESASNHGLPIHWATRYAEEGDEQRVNGTTERPEVADQQGAKSKRDEEKNESRNTVSIAVTATASPATVTPRTIGTSAVRPSVKVPSRRYEPPFLPEESNRRSSSSGPDTTDLNTIPTTSSRLPTVSNAPTTTRPRLSTTSRLSTPRSTAAFTTKTTTTTTKVPGTSVSPSTRKPSQQQLPRAQPGPQFAGPLAAGSSSSRSNNQPSDPRQSSLPASPIIFSPPAATAGLFDNPYALQRPQIVPVGTPPDRVPIPSRDLLPPYENIANFDQIKTRYTSESIYTRPAITNEPSAGPVKTAIDKLADTADPAPAPVAPAQGSDKIPRPFSIAAPPNDLLPPRKEYVFYDDATTQGPPIYYQWKWSVPSFGLDPPGLEAPPPPPPAELANTAENRRSNPGDVTLQAQEEEKLSAQLNPNAQQDQRDGADGRQRRGQNREHNQTARSISSETGTHGENRVVEIDSKRVVQLPQHNYLALRQQFAIPDFTFPLDLGTVAKGGQYEQVDAVDSFQVHIPSDVSVRSGSDSGKRPWYGENARCPECHPGFLRPGTCEPCVKVRR
ncbi:uncharacterized protein KIAA1522 [Anopheles bellator]|uniref:uncharacterized protein KIAA1522 n=1 Tax=Anopheles bellator TaxID=139047 RepID=UPI002648E62E|nr:uncharacterized protein KIAA1522 [Anopheles bellator]